MLLKNVISIGLSPPSVEPVDLRIRNGSLVERGRNLPQGQREEICDLKGKIVFPGFVCAHTHLYSTLARGMPSPAQPPQSFLDILSQVWWKLDRALVKESIYYSALVGAIEAASCGTTMIVDHHASPMVIRGSLDIIKEAMEAVGIRGLLAYEVTDRGGLNARDKGINENERFIEANRVNTHFRGMVGAHASFTLSNASLQLCGELAEETRTGVHIHVAEDMCDVTDARENYMSGVVQRLSEHHLLRAGSIFAHCVHLSPAEFTSLHKAKCWLVHNPRSNMNNRVGYAPLQLFGTRSALGTDGFPADMLEEARIGFFKGREAEGRADPHELLRMLAGGQGMVSEIFGKEFGSLSKGSAADLVVVNYQPPTPMADDNLASHVLFGMRSSMVESVMVGGKWIMEDRRILGVDIPSVYEKAQAAAKKLWKRMEKF